MADSVPGSATAPYREFLPDLSQPRFTTMQKQDAHTYAAAFKRDHQPPWLHALYVHWQNLWQEPFRGVTNDGVVRQDLFPIEDEGVSDAAAQAADRVVSLVAADPALWQKKKHAPTPLVYHIDDPSWRFWSNPEFLLSDRGVRLDEVTSTVRDAVFDVLAAVLSPEGFQKARGAMRINGFLGELVGARAVVNELSYNFVLYGTAGAPFAGSGKPWGLSFYGHHLCLNAFFTGRGQMVLSPFFLGAEPNVIDSSNSPHAGTRILVAEEEQGLTLMRSLSPELREKATIYKQLRDPAMPHGRWNHDDQRHLCGAGRDNRVVPYEGVLVGEHFSGAQKEALLKLVGEFLVLLPENARARRLALVKDWLHETYFSWIGGHGDTDAFYFRVQSPVIVVEFDHHSGVFLTNTEPARFHIHTIVRTPNAGDYGVALRRQLPSTVKQEFLWEGDRR